MVRYRNSAEVLDYLWVQYFRTGDKRLLIFAKIMEWSDSFCCRLDRAMSRKSSNA